MTTKLISNIQQALRDFQIDGWLFCDYELRDPIAYTVLGIDRDKLTTRRWYYFIPAEGEPIKLVHAIERNRLSELTGNTIIYFGWVQMHAGLARLLPSKSRIAMQYSANNDIPSVSFVDGGTIELVRSLGIEVVSSADLVQLFVSRLTDDGICLYKRAGEKIHQIKDEIFAVIFNKVSSGNRITEYDAQQFILEQFDRENLTSDGMPPIVAVNAHAADPHFEPTPNNPKRICVNDRILIDLWAKINSPSGIYYDITWCGYIGDTPPRDYVELFYIVVQARDLGKNFIVENLRKGEKVFGWQVDDVCRQYITSKGHGDYFIHRTGHSIDTHVHGKGANLDNLETRDTRQIITDTCFSIEPGIYKGDVGVRSEISVLVDRNKEIIIVGPEQEQLVLPRSSKI